MSKAYKTLIIDDEAPARSRLSRLLAKHKTIVSIVDEAENGEEGTKKINALKPDLIFLDVQMPGLNGFEMLKKIEHMPKVIFTTAYEEYAIKAFEENSIDYLLKPIEEDRLAISIQKLEKINSAHSTMNESALDKIVQTINKNSSPIHSIPVKKGDRIFIIKLDDIAFFEAKEKYVFIHTKDNQEHLIDYTL